MIRIYKTINNVFTEIPEVIPKCWINISNPFEAELKNFSDEFNIPLDFLTDSLDINERSRVETENNCTLIVCRAPVRETNNKDIPFATIPIGIVIKQEMIITICLSDAAEILDLFSTKIRHFSTENRNQFVIHLFHRSAFLYLQSLEKLDEHTDVIETRLQKSMRNEELIKLLNIEKSLVYFTTSLKSNQLMIERLARIKTLAFSAEDLDFLEDSSIDHIQAMEMAEIHSNILSGMMDAFASVISNNLNIVMKFLTSITLILMIPTLVASIYGMNVKLPFQHSPHAFTITMAASLVISLSAAWIFLKKRWM